MLHISSVAAGWLHSARNFIFLMESEPCWVRKLRDRGKRETNFVIFLNYLFQTQRNEQSRYGKKALLVVEF